MERFGGMTWEDFQALVKAGDTIVVATEEAPMVVMPLWRYRALLELGEGVSPKSAHHEAVKAVEIAPELAMEPVSVPTMAPARQESLVQAEGMYSPAGAEEGGGVGTQNDAESSPEYDQDAVEAAILAAQARFAAPIAPLGRPEGLKKIVKTSVFSGEEAFYLR